MALWKNPELVRHLRSELRLNRAAAAGFVVIAVCVLVGLGAWADHQSELEHARHAAVQFDSVWSERAQALAKDSSDLWRRFYVVIMLIQGGALTFWSLFACTQAVSGERENKTWDFQRITRLSSVEIAVGKLIGEPLLVYLAVLCCFPVATVAGLAARFSLFYILGAYLLMFSSAVFAGLAGLCLSCLLENRSRGIGMLGATGLYLVLIFVTRDFTESRWPGIAAFSPLMAGLSLVGLEKPGYVAILFGRAIPWIAMSLILYVTFGAWIALIIIRNIKRDYSEVRPLSHWESVGCAGFLNSIIYALFYPSRMNSMSASDFVSFVAALNFAILFAMGVFTLTSQEQLKSARRQPSAWMGRFLSEKGLPWPWLAVSAFIAYVLLTCGLLAWRHDLKPVRDVFVVGALQMLVTLVFVTRDVLFLQWCKLTRMRMPLVKGVLYLGLYYSTTIVQFFALDVESHTLARYTASILTPAGIVLVSADAGRYITSVIAGIVVQLLLAGALLSAIYGRIRRPICSSPKAG